MLGLDGGPGPTHSGRARVSDTTLKERHDGEGRAAIEIRRTNGARCALMNCVLWREL